MVIINKQICKLLTLQVIQKKSKLLEYVVLKNAVHWYYKYIMLLKNSSELRQILYGDGC